QLGRRLSAERPVANLRVAGRTELHDLARVLGGIRQNLVDEIVSRCHAPCEWIVRKCFAENRDAVAQPVVVRAVPSERLVRRKDPAAGRDRVGDHLLERRTAIESAAATPAAGAVAAAGGTAPESAATECAAGHSTLRSRARAAEVTV